MSGDRARGRTALAPSLDLVVVPEETTHLVCCRDVPWRRTFCGAEGTALNVVAVHFCSMCLDEAESRRPGWALSEPVLCPVDGDPCPSEQELAERTAREAGGSE